MKQRTVYLVKTAEGFVGNRRFSYALGSHSHRNRPFKDARLFARRQDANDALWLPTDQVVEATVTL